MLICVNSITCLNLGMNYPVFILHELVLRLSDVNKQIGRYWGSSFEQNECVIETTAGKIKVALDFLEKQYRDPKLISAEEVVDLTKRFELVATRS